MSYPEVVRGHDRVCIDLDGTLAESTWPLNHIGEVLPHAHELLSHYADEGYGIVIYTSRPASHEAEIWRWLTEHDLAHLVWEVRTDKPLAGLYIDDMAENIREVVK